MSVSLFQGTDMDAPRCLPVAGGMACVFTERRPGRETDNEDALAVIPGDDDSGVLAVADGLGGLPSGALASGLALQALAGHTAGRPGPVLREAILSGLDQANESILADGHGGATTVAVAGIVNSSLQGSLVGDSMVVVCGQRGRVKYRSVPQSPVGRAEAEGDLGEVEAMFHPQRHLVSNVVGMAHMHVELGPLIPLARYDTVIIGTDGLFDNLYVGEIIQHVRCGALAKAAVALLDDCRARMRDVSADRPHKPDDLAFILYRRN